MSTTNSGATMGIVMMVVLVTLGCLIALILYNMANGTFFNKTKTTAS